MRRTGENGDPGRDPRVPRFAFTRDPKRPRLEVITDVRGMRKWSGDAKAEIVLEALARGRLYRGGAPSRPKAQQVFGCLREARKAAGVCAGGGSNRDRRGSGAQRPRG